MISFSSDYTEGAHPKILEAFVRTNMEQLSGYGTDKYCASAKEKILRACGCPDGEVKFIAGGTQTNAVVIASMLQRYQGVIAAHTGHIAIHEAGAIEFTGHKVLELPGHEGKINADELKDYLVTYFADDNHESMVEPGMVYISHPSEYGTLYTKGELNKIADICKEYDLKLFLDGARLGYGLMAPDTDVTLADIANFCDVFYIGGTKVGALCGEAVVFPKGDAPKHFYSLIKQQGALLAKGRLLGIQFDTLFTDDLYFEISKNAIDMAGKLKRLLKMKDCTFFLETPTNQQFVIIENSKLKELEKNVTVGFWEKYDDTHSVVRFATSWATTEESLNILRDYL